MKKNIWILIFLIFLGSCTESVKRNEKWSDLDLTGKKLTLIDAERIEVLSFGDDGVVLGTFGTKGGGVFAPVVFWRIERDALIISDEKNSLARSSYSLKTIKGNVLQVSTLILPGRCKVIAVNCYSIQLKEAILRQMMPLWGREGRRMAAGPCRVPVLSHRI